MAKFTKIKIFLSFSGMTGKHQLEDEESNSQHPRRHEKRTTNFLSNGGQKFAGLYTGPYFDPSMPTNVSVQLGDTALLICKVNQVGRRTVLLFFAHPIPNRALSKLQRGFYFWKVFHIFDVPKMHFWGFFLVEKKEILFFLHSTYPHRVQF